MKRFLVFVRKEFLHIFRDIRTLFMVFLTPAALILLFGFVVSTDLKNAKVAVLDLSRDDITRRITSKIGSSGFFNLTTPLTRYDQIEQVLRANQARAVVVFGAHFGRDLLNGNQGQVHIIADGSEPNMATLTTGYLNAILQDFSREVSPAAQFTGPIIVPEVQMVYNPSLKGQHMFVPGVITLILILICALMTSITITREKEYGTMEALLVSPLRPLQIILGKIVPYFILSFLDVVLILLLSWYVFDLPIRGSLALLLGESMLYILMSLSIGILISTVSRTMQQAIFISLVGMMLPTILLSGFIFPIENMPRIYGWISSILPPRYFVTIIKSIMIKGVGFTMIWKETLMLIGFTLLAIAISIQKFRIRLQ